MEQMEFTSTEATIYILKDIYNQSKEAKSKLRLKDDKYAIDIFFKDIDYIVSWLEKDEVDSEVKGIIEEMAMSMVRAWLAGRSCGKTL